MQNLLFSSLCLAGAPALAIILLGTPVPSRAQSEPVPFYEEHVLPTEFIGGGQSQHKSIHSNCFVRTLPFVFRYYEEQFESVNICVPGYFDFRSAARQPDRSYDEEALIATTRVAPMWNDWHAYNPLPAVQIYIHQPTPTTFAIRWEGIQRDTNVNFEVVLDSTDNSIRYNYGEGNLGIDPVVGISEGSGRFRLAPHNDARSLGNAASILYTPRPGFVMSGTPSLRQRGCVSDHLSDIEVAIRSVGGFSDPVTLSVADLPVAFSASFTDNPIVPGTQSTARIEMGAEASPGTHVFSIVGAAASGDIATRTLPVEVQVSNTPLEAATLGDPVDGVVDLLLEPSFDWSAVAGAEYVLEIDDDPLFRSPEYTAATSSRRSHTVAKPLSPGTTFYWRVSTRNGCGTTPSAVRTFRTALYCSVPEEVIPADRFAIAEDDLVLPNAGTITDVDVTLSVSEGHDFSAYLSHRDTALSADLFTSCSFSRLEATFDDEVGGNSHLFCELSPPDGQVPGPELSRFEGDDLSGTWTLSTNQDDTDHEALLTYWCLEPTLSSGVSILTPTSSKVACGPADVVELDLEVSGVGGLSNPIVLDYVTLPAGFSGTFSENPVPPGGSVLAQITVSDSVAPANYQLAIRGSAVGATSHTVGFDVTVVAEVPATPSTVAPEDGEVLNTRTPTFSWENVHGAGSYVLEIDGDPLFGSPNYTATVEGTSHTVETPLVNHTQLYWRVRPVNSCGEGSFSDGSAFVIMDAPCRRPNMVVDWGDYKTDQLMVTEVEAQLLSNLADLDVRLKIDATHVGLVEATLTHEETGTSVVIVDRPGAPDVEGGCWFSDMNATLDDEAEERIETECAITSPYASRYAIVGAFSPNNALSAFDGESLAGAWTLRVAHHGPANERPITVDEWCLMPTFPSVCVTDCGNACATNDQDEDGIPDRQDNCSEVPNPFQRDTDQDGYGNVCDGDLNNDGVIDFLDLGHLKSAFFTDDHDADFNGDGVVDFLDLGLFKSMFFGTPGPGRAECGAAAATSS